MICLEVVHAESDKQVLLRRFCCGSFVHPICLLRWYEIADSEELYRLRGRTVTRLVWFGTCPNCRDENLVFTPCYCCYCSTGHCCNKDCPVSVERGLPCHVGCCNAFRDD